MDYIIYGSIQFRSRGPWGHIEYSKYQYTGTPPIPSAVSAESQEIKSDE